VSTSAEAITEGNEKKKEKRIREGIVLKAKMQKTVIVEVTRILLHSKFKKVVRNKIRYAAHDEKNEAKVGDKVVITHTRPISKTKSWRVIKVVKA